MQVFHFSKLIHGFARKKFLNTEVHFPGHLLRFHFFDTLSNIDMRKNRNCSRENDIIVEKHYLFTREFIYFRFQDKYVLIQIFMLTVLVVAFALLHLFYRSFKVMIDFTQDPVHCTTRIHFWNPKNSCELQAFANFSDLLTMAIHASLQVFFNIYFCLLASKKASSIASPAPPFKELKWHLIKLK